MSISNQSAIDRVCSPSYEKFNSSYKGLHLSDVLQGELERKLMNRRSLDDDGLPASPIGTPTATDMLSQPSYMVSIRSV